jgi:hypothetical protein
VTEESRLWEQAGQCYQEAGLTAEAARCYRSGGLFRRAGDLYRSLGRPHEAAEMYERGHHGLEAAWLLAHEVGNASAARACLARLDSSDHAAPSPAGELTRQLLSSLVAARCDLIDGEPVEDVIAVLTRTQDELAGDGLLSDPRVIDWASTVAELMHRFDQVALLYAAAVRGRRYRAAENWSAWSLSRFGVPIVMPAPSGA